MQDPDVTREPGTLHRRASRWPAILLCAAALGSLANAGTATGLVDLDGRTIDPFEASRGAKVIVFLFTSVECPISNRYAPVVADLHREFSGKGVRFWLVYPAASDTGESIQRHLKAFSY